MSLPSLEGSLTFTYMPIYKKTIKELPMDKNIFRRKLKFERSALINAKDILEKRIESMDELIEDLDRL